MYLIIILYDAGPNPDYHIWKNIKFGAETIPEALRILSINVPLVRGKISQIQIRMEKKSSTYHLTDEGKKILKEFGLYEEK